METYEQQRAALDAQHTKALAELETKRAIQLAIPPELLGYVSYIHITPLYDRAGSIKVSSSRYESLRKGQPPPTIDTLEAFARAFPDSAPLTVYRDGCVGIRTAADAHRQAEKRGNDPTVLPVAPFWVEVHPSSHSTELSFHWIATVAGHLMEFEIEFPLYGELARKVGACHIQQDNQGERPGVVHSNRYEVDPRVLYLNNAKAFTITYGSGDRFTPGQHLIYWDSGNGEHADCTILDLINKLRE